MPGSKYLAWTWYQPLNWDTLGPAVKSKADVPESPCRDSRGVSFLRPLSRVLRSPAASIWALEADIEWIQREDPPLGQIRANGVKLADPE